MIRDGKVDAIRTFCVLWVVLIAHMDEYINLDFSSPIFLAITKIVLVELFFISGWCARNKKMNTRKQIFLFYCKKLKRLYPLYLIALFFLMLVSYLFGFSYATGRSRIVGGIFLVGAFISPPIATLYFVNILVFFFAITPIIKQDTKEKSIIALINTVIVLIALRQNRVFSIDIRAIFYLPAYFSGVNYELFSHKKNKNMIIVEIVALVIFIFAYINLQKEEKFAYKWLVETVIIWGMCFFSITIFAPTNHLVIGKNGIIKILAYSGYCIYLFHRVYYSTLYYLFGELSPAFAYLIAFPGLVAVAYIIQLIYDFVLDKLQRKRIVE